jgi:hypothetical protein
MRSWLCILTFVLAGCGSDGQASLIGRVERPALSVDRSLVGADASGGFDLVLELGEFASGPTSVGLGAFSIERDGTALLSPLSLAGATFPVTVAAGAKRSIRLTLDATPTTDEAEALCEGGIAFRGSVTDSLSGNRPITLTSAVFTPACMGP